MPASGEAIAVSLVGLLGLVLVRLRGLRIFTIYNCQTSDVSAI